MSTDKEKNEITVLAVNSLLTLALIILCFAAIPPIAVYSAAFSLVVCLISYAFYGKHTRELLRVLLAVQIIILFIYIPKMGQ